MNATSSQSFFSYLADVSDELAVRQAQKRKEAEIRKKLEAAARTKARKH